MLHMSGLTRRGIKQLQWSESQLRCLSHCFTNYEDAPTTVFMAQTNLITPKKGLTTQQPLHKGKSHYSILCRKNSRTECHPRLHLRNFETSSKFFTCSRLFSNTAAVSAKPPTITKKKKFSLNPIDDLQPLVQVPLLPQIERVVDPTGEEVQRAAQLFRPAGQRHKIEFVLSAPSPDHAPENSRPEIAIMGRSNVGKSTLLQCLFREVPNLVVKTSKTPGHTKMANFFRVGSAMTLVDMPGYGYRQPADFVHIVEDYLLQRKNLRMAVFMVDGAAGIASWDTVAIEMIEEFKRPYVLVMTKIDKVSQHVLLKNVLAVRQVIKERTKACLPQVFLVSGMTGDGVPLLQYFFAQVTDSLK
ncbi:GTP-binding protein 8-like isoform X1 [Branchiostoma floridae]|uniref:GTP-binding protein 8 n=1 Tax=Branchiostoma floridae TaxID=7739 RepID=A0A9J7LHG3_BRAFL|nr:GTP-binding protein 8-like isoform X1 [Branchiostoma floridae]